VLVLACPCGIAQTGNGTDNPDWVEEPPPPPPQFSKDHLIAIDMPLHVSVRFGVDPSTIAVGTDGVVRYVMVITNATGNTNASYEGIRCVSDEVKTYARLSSSGKWVMVDSPSWKGVGENMPSRHAQAFARQGGCQKRQATSPQEIIAALKSAGWSSDPQKGK
jgi:hypothetical protein